MTNIEKKATNYLRYMNAFIKKIQFNKVSYKKINKWILNIHNKVNEYLA